MALQEEWDRITIDEVNALFLRLTTVWQRGRCSRAVLDFLSSTDVGRRVPAEAEDDAVSAVSELEVREWLEEQGAGAEEPGAGGEPPLFLPTPDFMASAGTA